MIIQAPYYLGKGLTGFFTTSSWNILAGIDIEQGLGGTIIQTIGIVISAISPYIWAECVEATPLMRADRVLLALIGIIQECLAHFLDEPIPSCPLVNKFLPILVAQGIG